MSTQLYTTLKGHLGFEPTDDQKIVLELLSDFVLTPEPNALFLLKGYAGTGKTSIICSLVNTFEEIGCEYVLLAPTGKAAKVMTNYTNKVAYTIHKKIYYSDVNDTGQYHNKKQKNKHTKTFFIVDEASMIANEAEGFNEFASPQSLLDDLIEYVYNQDDCKLILIGDTAQLPPVGLAISPALDAQYLQSAHFHQVTSYEMTQVVRQDKQSDILRQATLLRQKIQNENFSFPYFELPSKQKEVKRIEGSDIQDYLESAYSNYGKQETIIICRSNKNANLYNAQIRVRVWDLEDILSGGDMLTVVKNNYFYSSEEIELIANGEMLQLKRVRNIQQIYGHEFADATICLIDHPQELELTVKLLLSTIMAPTPNLSFVQQQELYQHIAHDYLPGCISKRDLKQKMDKDAYYHALQIKYGYALTCHKAQGGQWDCVFIDLGFFTEEMLTIEFIRWLYTAITRAKKQVYLINFPDAFFE